VTIQGPAPATSTDNGDRLDWSTLVGSLLLLDVGSLEVDIQTQYGSADAVRCDVWVLDGPLAHTGWENTLAWGTVLITQLSPRQGQKVCARLAYGTAKAGRSAPYILTDPTPEDLAKATQWDQQRNAPQPPVPVVANHPTPGGTSVYQLQQQAAAAKLGGADPTAPF